MPIFKPAALLLKTVMLMLLLSALTSCHLLRPTPPVVILQESKVQKISKGESADFDGYVLSDAAAIRLIEAAERCTK